MIATDLAVVATPAPASASSVDMDSSVAPTALAPAHDSTAYNADEKKTSKKKKDAGPEYDVSGNAQWFANNNNNNKGVWNNDVVASSAGVQRGIGFVALLSHIAARWA
jgi:hypothetical protein